MNKDSEDKLLADLQREDVLGIVVRAHIHIENHLLEFINKLADDTYIKRMSLEYEQKVFLATALGLNERFRGPLQNLGNIRNRFAHKLDSVLDAQEVNNFYDSFNPEDKTIIQSCHRRTLKLSNVDIKTKFSDLDANTRFILLVLSLRAMLITAVEQLEHQS